MCHQDNAFVTLTYDEENLPGNMSVEPLEVQNWLKRIRLAVEPRRIRFYLVGEYGDDTHRPHYHVALFNFPTCIRGRTEHRAAVCCSRCQLVKDSWGKGGVDVGELTLQSAAYVAGYVTKKMTKKDDPRLNGRHPEFARMSLKPGIGALSVPDIARLVKSDEYSSKLEFDGDVPLSLMSGRKSMPLGRYLRRKLREEIGRSPDTPKSVLGRLVAEVSAVLKEVRKEAEEDNTPESFMDKKGLTLRLNCQKIRNVEARSKIYEQKRSL